MKHLFLALCLPLVRFNITLLPLAALLCGTLHAEVKPNPLFADHAVLQRGQKIPVWGSARDGEKVTVEFQNQKISTTAENGKCSVHLDPLKEGGPFTMTVSGDNTVTIKDLLVGEVWICSGQSNMEFLFSKSHNASEEAPKADYPQIRMFTVRRVVSAKPLDEAIGGWSVCSPQKINAFSAVGYFFARDLHQKLGVPVGMLHASWGGTPAQAWTSLEGFGQQPELQEYVAAARQKLATYDADVLAYEPKMKEFKTKRNEWLETASYPYEAAKKRWNEDAAKAKQAGQAAPPKPALPIRPPPAPN